MAKIRGKSGAKSGVPVLGPALKRCPETYSSVQVLRASERQEI